MFRQLAKIMIVDALGKDKEILEALPYTQIHFDQPVIANALERAQMGKFHSENIFNLVSAQVPVDIAVEMADKNAPSDMRTTADILKRLHEIQSKVEENDEKREALEEKEKKAQIEQIQVQTEVAEKSAQAVTVPSGGTGKKGSGESEKGSIKGKSPAKEEQEKARSKNNEGGYSRLEQKQHEKARLGSTKRSEKLAKFENKSV